MERSRSSGGTGGVDPHGAIRIDEQVRVSTVGDDGIVERPGQPPIVLPGRADALREVAEAAAVVRRYGGLAAAVAEAAGTDALDVLDVLVDEGVLHGWPLADRLLGLHRTTTGSSVPLRTTPSEDHGRMLRDVAGDPAVDLPDPSPPAIPLAEALGGRRSVRRFRGDAVSPAQLGAVLAGGGCRGWGDHDPPLPLRSMSPPGPRPYPSPGALYPTEVVVYAARVETIELGFHRYQPLRHRMVRTAPPVDEDRLVHLLNDHPVRGAAFVVFLWVDLAAPGLARYGEKIYRMLLLECGHLAHNLLLIGVSKGLAALPLCGFRDDELAVAAGLSPPYEVMLYALVFGVADPDASGGSLT